MSPIVADAHEAVAVAGHNLQSHGRQEQAADSHQLTGQYTLLMWGWGKGGRERERERKRERET